MPTDINKSANAGANSPAADDLDYAKLNAEAAKIAWKELQRFYASGVVIAVDPTLDLIDVAWNMSQDNAAQFQQWLNDNKVAPANDRQALAWFEADASLWAVTVKPWVLVQEITAA